jgi:dihydropteroate synthase
MWHCANFIFNTEAPLVMGILNVTPDSFSDGGEHDAPAAAIAHARLMCKQGAHIIDVGGESTRPGSDEVSLDEELARVLPVVRQLAAEGIAVSIDTRHAAVARACVEAGAVIINDISGFRDPAMVEVATGCEAGLVVMHMLGEPKDMQVDPHYGDVVVEVSAYLLTQAHMLEEAGVAPERICVDPGPGFGKTYEHNLALLRATRVLALLGYPLMVAYSRKGFIGALTGVEVARERVVGSVAVAVWAALQGAHVLRVHDVAPTTEALRTLRAVEGHRVWPEDNLTRTADVVL